MTTPTKADGRTVSAAIVGPGNIGTDLMYKLLRSPRHRTPLDDRGRSRLRRAQAGHIGGLEASAEGVDWLLAQPELPDIVFEATSAYVHVRNAPKYRKAGIPAVDLTPAARGPFVVPPANLMEHIDQMNLNMVTCGGQATIPMVHAVSRVVPVDYAEIVATVSSASAGPGTRQNIDEFTRTTSRAVEVVGGATRGKAIIILNPAEPPLMMRDTIYCSIPLDADTDAIEASIRSVVAEVATYVPGYHLVADPQFDVPFGHRSPPRRHLHRGRRRRRLPPPYAGNLDIMTAAATKVGNEIARVSRPRRPCDALLRHSRRPRHRHLPARRLTRQAPPVHRGRGALHRAWPRRRRHAGHRGHPRRRPRWIVLQLRVLAGRRTGPDEGCSRRRPATPRSLR
jgi:acetaldehyde dehydrogenase